MEMKDKLIKNHHKGIYYKTRQVFVGSIIAAAGFAVVAVPTYITMNSNAATLAQTQDNDDEDENKNKEENPAEIKALLSYYDVK